MLPVLNRFYRVALLLSVTLAGCGGADGRGDQKGVFLDSPVSGLKYSTGTFEGITEDDGSFYYTEGDEIVFSIGELSFPPVTGASTITPLEIAQVDDVENEKVVNLLRLLQSIDQDQNPGNGIVIPEEAHDKVSISRLSFDGSIDTEDFLKSIITQVYSANRTLVDKQSAVEHFVDTLSKHASGDTPDPQVNSLAFLVASGEDYDGDFLSVQDSQYALNMDGHWESGVAVQTHNILRLKSDHGVSRFVTARSADGQSEFCISSRPMRMDECQAGARLFSVYHDEKAAKAHKESVATAVVEVDEPDIGAAQSQETDPESESVASGERPGDANGTDTSSQEENAQSPGDGTSNQTNANNVGASTEFENTGGSNNSSGNSSSSENNAGTSGSGVEIIRVTTNCPSSVRAPAQFSVFAEEPAGCKWTSFDTPPWAWTPAAAYNSDTNTITVNEGGVYSGEFSHMCTDQSSGKVVKVNASCGFVADSAPVPADITDLFFITGQSNAAGLETSYDATVDIADSHVFAYTDNGWQVADLHQNWELSVPGNFSGTNPERMPYNHIGFQLTKAISEKSDRVVGLVVLTAPGEGISHWDYNSEFFTEIRQKATLALNALPHKSEFDAMIWMQGETDWLFEGTADPGATGFIDQTSEEYKNYYPNKLFQLMSNLRGESWFRFDGRFVCAETKKASLNGHLMALNSDDDPYSGCAAASDLPTRMTDPYGNHFSAESFRTLGKRLADVYLSMDE